MNDKGGKGRKLGGQTAKTADSSKTQKKTSPLERLAERAKKNDKK